MTQQHHTTTTLEDAEVQALASHLRSALIRPGDAGYDDARKVYNAMIDKRPALIARCAGVAEVVAAVHFAREQQLTLAVRGGGHNGPGLSTCDDGLMIDLSPMKGIQVDAATRAGRAALRAAPRLWPAGNRLRRADPLAHPPEHVRRALPARLAVVLEGRLLQRAERPGDRPAREVRHAAADHAFNHAHLPDRRRGRRVGRNETAFSFRDAKFAEVIVGVDPDPANNVRMIEWARDYWLALHPHSAGGAYVNMMMDEGDDQVKPAYRDNYAQLAAIKAKYDPANLFHVNQNIRPGAQES